MKPSFKSDEQQRDENVAFIWGVTVGILMTVLATLLIRFLFIL